MVTLVLGCGRVEFEPRVDAGGNDAGPPLDGCTDDAGCSLLRTETVGCGDGPTTGDQLCQRSGLAGATIANGYYWFQCTGYPEHVCPAGFDPELRCTTWCGNLDCVGYPYCGGGEQIREILGDGATVFDPMAYGLTCGAFNPGWLVRLECHG